MTDWRRLGECVPRAFGEWRRTEYGAAPERPTIVLTTVVGRTEAYSNEPRFAGMQAWRTGGAWQFGPGCSEEFQAEVTARARGAEVE